MIVYQNKHTKALITERDYNCLYSKQKEEMEVINIEGIEEFGLFPNLSVFTKEEKESLRIGIIIGIGQN